MPDGGPPVAAPHAVLIGVGNPLRGDDGAGPAVARLARQSAPAGVEVLEHDGEPASLLEAWSAASVAVVVDAVRSGAPPGTIRRVDATAHPLPAPGGASTHGIGVAEAVELARALGRLPQRLVVLCVEGEDFATGEALTPAVRRALAPAAEAALAELRR